MNLKRRLLIRTGVVFPLLLGFLFAPAGSFRFWQAWVFLAVSTGLNAWFVLDLYKRDPGLLTRRLQSKESRPAQKVFQISWMLLWVALLMVPGFDYRFGWSARLGGVPVWLTVVGYVAFFAGGWIASTVLRWNSFAASVIQVEPGQKVITGGPYRRVRHPMYSGFTLMTLGTPFTLGSYLALLPAILMIPPIVYRLIDEERFLRKELPGYAEYCERTRFRLIPSIY